jgi:uncharacterized protein (DUF2236 family)
VARRPLGSDSLLWRYAGDHRLAFTGLTAGILQLMHPAVGAGVAEHSAFFRDPWDRIIRSLPQILGAVYDPDAESLGHRVRDYHRPIKGRDHRGRPYRALDPETFWWAHATFQHAVKQIVDRFDTHRLTAPEKERLYLDGVEWYRRYGVTTKPVPVDYWAFRVKWKHICDDVLEMTPAAERAIDLALHERSMDMDFLPGWLKQIESTVVTPVLRLTAIGGLPAPVRQRFSIPWRLDQELEYRALCRTVSRAWTVVPPSRRYGPTAAAAMSECRTPDR